ncbi:hypothetical protein ACLKA6_005768 [Drosophila palustris]
MLDTHIETALKYQTRVESFDPDDEYRGELEELCITTKARLKALIKGLTPATQAVVPVAAPRTRLPHLALPKFSGKYSEFKNFISLFETLVHNDTTIPAIEKFNHLISCLSGEALGTTHPSSLATFVSNRVAEIQEWTENAEWRHVPTKQNPADIVSRGCDVDELVTSIWFNGPSFLKEPRDSWPVNQHLVTDEMRTLETVHCDNATNFVGASRQFRELRARVEEEADAIQEFASKSGCEFAFIPPRAPHFGGLWEAGVKSAKHLLLRTVGSLLLTAEELQTTLVAVEAVLNSRPIGALSDDPSDGEALTPGHALIGGPLTAMPAGGAPDQQGLTCLSRWRAVSSLRRQFWRRWSKEYILGLQARSKWHHRTPDVVVGELVVVAEDNLPPQKWLIGRVTAVHRGEDGAVRVVDLRTATGGAFRRPIHKLARLPIG